MTQTGNPDLPFQIAITMVDGIGGYTVRKLLDACGSAEAVFRESRTNLVKIPGIGDRIADRIRGFKDFRRTEQEIRFIEKHRIRALFLTDPEYPGRLKRCADGPVMLFVKGPANLHAEKMVAVVGTRSISGYGRKRCREIVEGLAAYKAVVVSGLAYGVDACAHQAAMDNGIPTMAVLGHGLDRIYPAQHASLAKKILNSGALLTDFPTGTVPGKENFPKRNRIIAGICDAVVVIEAALTGGALITANIADSYHRDVFALPGRTTDPYSMGCNKLIKSHKAHLIESAADLGFVMNWKPLQENSGPRQARLFPALTKDEAMLARLLKECGGSGADELAQRSGLPAGKIGSLLLTLELKGVVEPLPGRSYSLREGF
jgi:DNA processing protein